MLQMTPRRRARAFVAALSCAGLLVTGLPSASAASPLDSLAAGSLGSSTGTTAPDAPETPVEPDPGEPDPTEPIDGGDPTLPTVTVVATGGTLAGRATTQDSYSNYRAGTYPMAELIPEIAPAIDQMANVDIVQFGNAGSGGYTIAQYRELTLAVEQALVSSDAVVVTTGTDTMEEFGYWLDVTVQSKKPVVITGAMRPWAAGPTPDVDPVFGSDGPANLVQSIRLAASQQTYCFGTVLMLNDEIHAARDVTKGNTMRTDTFESRRVGVLGWIDGDRISLPRGPSRVLDCQSDRWLTPFDLSEISASDLPKVEIFYNYQEASGDAIRGMVTGGATGIVTAGTGAGGISSAAGQARRDAIAQGVWFVSTSRTGSGTVGPTSAAGMISGNELLPQKARLLLILSRAYTDDITVARDWFATAGNPGFGNASAAVDVQSVPDGVLEPVA
ncbi:L-asparaginase [Dietzia sp. 2505]